MVGNKLDGSLYNRMFNRLVWGSVPFGLGISPLVQEGVKGLDTDLNGHGQGAGIQD